MKVYMLNDNSGKIKESMRNSLLSFKGVMSNNPKLKSKYKKHQTETKRNKDGKLEVLSLDDAWGVLNFGGVGKFLAIIDGKKVNMSISVDNGLNMSKNIPKFKWHFRNAFGYRVFIKTQTRKTAQIVVDYLYGRGTYTVSGSDV